MLNKEIENLDTEITARSHGTVNERLLASKCVNYKDIVYRLAWLDKTSTSEFIKYSWTWKLETLDLKLTLRSLDERVVNEKYVFSALMVVTVRDGCFLESTYNDILVGLLGEYQTRTTTTVTGRKTQHPYSFVRNRLLYVIHYFNKRPISLSITLLKVKIIIFQYNYYEDERFNCQCVNSFYDKPVY